MPAFNRTELADLNVFVTICRRRSFRQAAVELGVSTSALSHAMRNLEARLGVKLLNRTSRSVVPTAAGAALAEQLGDGFATIGAAIDQLDRYRTSPIGRLRINVPRDASRLLIGPILPAFIEAYPEIQLDITVDDRLIDIVADGYDAGIRYGDTVAGDMIAVPLTPALRWVIVGSPSYLKRYGRPAKPDDLMRHACIRMRIGDNSLYRWELGNGRRALEIDVPGPVSVNETDAAVEAALSGVGLVVLQAKRERKTRRLELLGRDHRSIDLVGRNVEVRISQQADEVHRVDAGFAGHRAGLAQRLDHHREHEVPEELDEIRLRRIGPDDADGLSHLFQQGHGNLQVRIRARGHDEKLARRRGVGPAKHRRRDEAHSCVKMTDGQHLRGFHADRAERDMHRAGLEPREDAGLTHCDGSQCRIVGDHREHDIGLMCGFGWARRDRSPRPAQGFRPSRVAVEHADLVPGLDQVRGNRGAHCAQPNKSNLHDESPNDSQCWWRNVPAMARQWHDDGGARPVTRACRANAATVP